MTITRGRHRCIESVNIECKLFFLTTHENETFL